MYCLSLIVSDYPSKLSHDKLDPQQVPCLVFVKYATAKSNQNLFGISDVHRLCSYFRLLPNTRHLPQRTCVVTHAASSKTSSYAFLKVCNRFCRGLLSVSYSAAATRALVFVRWLASERSCRFHSFSTDLPCDCR